MEANILCLPTFTSHYAVVSAGAHTSLRLTFAKMDGLFHVLAWHGEPAWSIHFPHFEVVSINQSPVLPRICLEHVAFSE